MGRSNKIPDAISNTGFGANQGARLVRPDGTPNLVKRGIPLWARISMYHSLLRMPRMRFLGVVFLFYTSINVVFALLYYFIGVEHLSGNEAAVTKTDQFLKAFFFSAQTITTVGYGHTAPLTIAANVVASFESLIGILAFALVTGLFYGRFAKPKAFILFSSKMIVAPHKGGRAIMIRVATYKNNHLTDAEAIVTAAMTDPRGTTPQAKFYPLKLEISKINSMALSWTIVHSIDDASPFFQCTEADIRTRKLELIVAIKAFDDHFSNTVQQRTSYTVETMLYGVKFLPMFEHAPDGDYTILNLDEIDKNAVAEMPLAEADTVIT